MYPRLIGSPRLGAVFFVCVMAVVAVLATGAPRAGAFIYWSQDRCIPNANGPGLGLKCRGTIGRAGMKGTGADERFFDSPRAAHVRGLAVDDGRIYWAWSRSPRGAIARARLNGRGVQPRFITGITASPLSLALGDGFVYWTDNPCAGHVCDQPRIGRAGVNGERVDESFIVSSVYGFAFLDLAADGEHLYWAIDSGANSIGRANLDGTEVDESFIDVGATPLGVAVDGEHIYWASREEGIGRADLDGTNVDRRFITPRRTKLSDVAIDDKHIYWTGTGTLRSGSHVGLIGRARLGGEDVEERFVTLRRRTKPGDLAVAH